MNLNCSHALVLLLSLVLMPAQSALKTRAQSRPAPSSVLPPWAPPTTSPATTTRAAQPAEEPLPELSGAEAAARVEALGAAQAAGQHQQVIHDGLALLARLPPEARSLAWQIPFNRRVPAQALLGDRLGYYVLSPRPLQRSASAQGSNAPDEPPDLPIRPEFLEGFREVKNVPTVTCVELATGRRLWTRPTAFSLGLDPRDDAVWAWTSGGELPRAMRWDPATGVTTREIALPPVQDMPRGSPTRIAALRQDGALIWDRSADVPRDGEGVLIFDLDSKSYEVSPNWPRLSWNRLSYLDLGPASGTSGNSTVSLRPASPESRPIWSTEIHGFSENPPVWMQTGETGAAAADDTDVLLLAGSPETHGAVYRLDGNAGSVLWRTALPEPAFSTLRLSLPSGVRPELGPGPIAQMGGYIAALGSHGSLFLLDPDDGEIAAAYPLESVPLAMPRLVEGLLVLATLNGVEAVPLEAILAPDAAQSMTIARTVAKSLLATQRYDEAVALARGMVRRARHSPLAWRTLAEASELSNALDRAEVPAIWARYMQLARLPTLPVLEQTHGLLRRVPTAGIVAPLVPGDVTVLAGTLGGELLSVDARTGELIGRELIPTVSRSLVLRDRTLYTLTSRHERVALRTFANPPDVPPHDPLHGWLNPEEDPGRATAREIAAYDAGAVELDGMMVRPLWRGATRVQDADGPPNVFRDHPSILEGVGEWRIGSAGARPLGYGGGSVWALDDHFRPAKLLHSVDRGQVFEVLGGEDVTVVLVGLPDAQRLQIWTQDFGRKLNDQPVTPGGIYHDMPKLRGEYPHEPRPGRMEPFPRPNMMRLGEGVLYWSDFLLWVPDDPAKPVWRWDLHLSLDPDQPGRDSPNVDTAELGVPRVVGGNLFVAARGGGIFVFDVDHVTGRAVEVGGGL